MNLKLNDMYLLYWTNPVEGVHIKLNGFEGFTFFLLTINFKVCFSFADEIFILCEDKKILKMIKNT